MISNCVTRDKKIRWEYIDLLKFIGIFFVLLYHATTYSYNWAEEADFLYYLRYYLRTILSTCVPLFFFSNGYLLLNRSFDLKKHIIKSIRIVVLTVAWGIINILLIMPIENEILSLNEMFAALWNWRDGWINHLWYMGALVCVYVFLPLLKSVFDTNRNAFIYFTIITAILTFGNTIINITGSLVIGSFKGVDSAFAINWFNIFNPFRGIYGYAFAYFCLGGLAHDFKDRIVAIPRVKRNIFAIITIIISCFILFIIGIGMTKTTGAIWDVVWGGYDTIPTLVNVLAIFVLSLSLKKTGSAVRYVSSNTLGIYFIHQIFIHLLIRYAESTAIFSTFTGCFVFAVFLLSICLGTVIVIKKIPIVKKILEI